VKRSFYIQRIFLANACASSGLSNPWTQSGSPVLQTCRIQSHIWRTSGSFSSHCRSSGTTVRILQPLVRKVLVSHNTALHGGPQWRGVSAPLICRNSIIQSLTKVKYLHEDCRPTFRFRAVGRSGRSPRFKIAAPSGPILPFKRRPLPLQIRARFHELVRDQKSLNRSAHPVFLRIRKYPGTRPVQRDPG
jgi:hypothetical protein